MTVMTVVTVPFWAQSLADLVQVRVGGDRGGRSEPSSGRSKRGENECNWPSLSNPFTRFHAGMTVMTVMTQFSRRRKKCSR